MKHMLFVMIVVFFVNCSSNSSNKYRKIISLESSKAIFQTIDSVTDNVWLDTVEVSWNGERLIRKVIHDRNKGEKMLLVDISLYDFEKGEVQENHLNYDLLGDSIRYIDTSFHEIGKRKKYIIEGDIFELVKEDNSVFNKSNKPNCYAYISKEYGLIGLVYKSEKRLLIGYEKRELGEVEQHLINLLAKDVEFFTL